MSIIESDISVYASQVVIYGASDMEQGWATASATITWFQGYENHVGRPTFWNFGSASECPTSGTGGCNNGWTQANIHFVSWDGPGWPFPQIYSSTLAAEWANISNTRGYMSFEGSLSEYLAAHSRGIRRSAAVLTKVLTIRGSSFTTPPGKTRRTPMTSVTREPVAPTYIDQEQP